MYCEPNIKVWEILLRTILGNFVGWSDGLVEEADDGLINGAADGLYRVSIKGSQDLSGRIVMDEKRVPSESFNLKEVRKTHMIYKAFDLST